MSRCPNCGYPVRGRPDYVDDYDPAAPENFDDPYRAARGLPPSGGELPVYEFDPNDSVLGVLGDPNRDIEPPRPWWRLW